jgi:hypothetical protein
LSKRPPSLDPNKSVIVMGVASWPPLWRTLNLEEGRIEWHCEGCLVGWVQSDTVRSLKEAIRLERFIFCEPPCPTIDPR